MRADDEALTTAIIAVVDSDNVTGLCGVEWKVENQSDVITTTGVFCCWFNSVGQRSTEKVGERGTSTHDDVFAGHDAVVVAAAVGCRCACVL